MFRSSNNVFSTVECPDLSSTGRCTVVNCLFRHPPSKRRHSTNGEATKKAKIGSHTVSEPPTAEKIETTAEAPDPPKKDVLFVIPKELDVDSKLSRVERSECTRKLAAFFKSKGLPTPNKLAIEEEFKLANISEDHVQYREHIQHCLGIKKAPQRDPEHIFPIEVSPSPDTLPTRRKYITILAEALRHASPELKTPMLKAMEEEYKIASSNSTATYGIAIKRRIYEIRNPDKVKVVKKTAPSKQDYITELRKLCIDPVKLAKFGYIMEPPPAIQEPKQVRQCHRCKSEFKLENAHKKVLCCYHSGKVVKTASGTRIYLCCQSVLGGTDTDPCAKSDYHVFYWTSPEELHHAQPFRKTSEMWGKKKGSLEAVGIDCEMGFTTNGFELLRITAIDYISGEEVLDILVRPKGEILDLNTRWSGIAEIKEEAVSFEELITLLGEVLDADTVMVGHGLENDMNAMRLIHHTVVDTAVLYPKHRATPTFRYSLKQLAFEYLGRTIQTGEHDSGEDSLAAIDVTKYFIEQDLARNT